MRAVGYRVGWHMDRVEENYVSIIETIYAAAVEAVHWPTVMGRLCDSYGGGQGILLRHDLTTGNGAFPIAVGQDPKWTAAYNTYYASRNPWLKNLKRRPVGLAVPAEFMFARQELIQTEFYNDFLKPQGLMSGVGLTVHQDEDRFVAVSVLYGEPDDAAHRANVGFLARLSPHFRRAMQVSRQLAEVGFSWRMAEEGFNRLIIGFALLKQSGKVLFANAEAERICRAEDGLKFCGGTIKAERSSDQVRLSAAVSQACGGGGGAGIASVSRRSGRRSYSVLAAPMGPPASLFHENMRCAALFISDPDARPMPPVEDLRRAFDLTPAEARLLQRLLHGSDLAGVATSLDLSVHTVRTQLRTLFRKMNCSRQSELLRAAMLHPAFLATFGE